MKTILVAVDLSGNTGLIVDQAAELVKDLNGKMILVHVTSDALQSSYDATTFYDISSEYVSAPVGDIELARDLCAEEYKREHRSLLGLSAFMRKEGVNAQAMLLKGDAAELILEKAAELHADMIVMGSCGHGLLRKVLVGSVAEAVLRKARCSVLIVPASKPAPVL